MNQWIRGHEFGVVGFPFGDKKGYNVLGKL